MLGTFAQIVESWEANGTTAECRGHMWHLIQKGSSVSLGSKPWQMVVLKPQAVRMEQTKSAPLLCRFWAFGFYQTQTESNLKNVQLFPPVVSFSNYLHSVYIILWITSDQEMIYRVEGKVCRLYANIVRFIQETRKFMSFESERCQEPVPFGYRATPTGPSQAY